VQQRLLQEHPLCAISVRPGMHGAQVLQQQPAQTGLHLHEQNPD
jgi:hypothetical protein